MKLKKIFIKNFKGIKEKEYDLSKKLTIISGPCGVGKSSFIEAVTLPLTNELPYEPIRLGEKEANILAEYDKLEEDGTISTYHVEKNILQPKKIVTKVSGRKVVGTKAGKFLEDLNEVDSNLIKITSSSKVLANLKPDAFASIFLSESMEKKTVKDLIKIIENSSTKEKKDLYNHYGLDFEDELPINVVNELKTKFIEDFTIDEIKDVYESFYKERKDINSKLKILQVKAKDFLEKEKPIFNKEDLTENLNRINLIEKNNDLLENQINNYESAIALEADRKNRIKEIDLLILKHSYRNLDKNELLNLENELKKTNSDITTQTVILQTLNDTKDRIKKTIENLNTNICPISSKICCTVDKTSLKDDLKKNVEKIEVSISVTKDIIKEKENLVEKIKEQIKQYKIIEAGLKEKEDLIAEKKRLEKNSFEIPVKPDKSLLYKENYKKEKEEILNKLDIINDYEKSQKEYLEFLALKEKYLIKNLFVKSLDIKGEVVKEFIKTLIEPIEDTCNDRVKLFNKDIQIKLISQDGLLVLFKMGTNKNFLPFNSLSSGEKVMALVILTDLINVFSGSGMLIIDDANHLDEQSFRCLMNFICNSETFDLYDNIIISTVNHSDIENVIKEYSKKEDIQHFNF